MAFGLALDQFSGTSESKINIVLRAVQNNDNNASVRIFKGNGFKLTCKFTASDTFCSSLYVLTKMSDVIIRIVNDDFIIFGICHNRSITKVPNVIWTAFSVKQQIPIQEHIAVIIEVSDHIVGILFADFYGIQHSAAIFIAAL